MIKSLIKLLIFIILSILFFVGCPLYTPIKYNLKDNPNITFDNVYIKVLHPDKLNFTPDRKCFYLNH